MHTLMHQSPLGIMAIFDMSSLWFTIPALVGTVYFAFTLIAGEIGGDAGAPTDIDIDVDGGLSDGPGTEFGLLSTQAIAALFMGGGWAGLASRHLLNHELSTSAIIAVVAGLAYGYLIARLLRFVAKMQSSGNISLIDTVGLTGPVYIEVPPKGQGRGRVTLIVNDMRREFSARQEGDEPIKTNTRVRVTSVDEASNTVTVEVPA